MIELSKNYRIVFDQNNVILEKLVRIGTPKNRKTANPRQEWKELTYHSTLKSALKNYTDLELKNSDSLEDLVCRLVALEKQINELLEFRRLEAEESRNVKN